LHTGQHVTVDGTTGVVTVQTPTTGRPQRAPHPEPTWARPR
jgi:hypothetical protein